METQGQTLLDKIRLCFVEDDRWTWLLDGLKNTLIITVFALILGVLIGIIVATIRSTYDKNKDSLKKKGGAGFVVLKIANAICRVFLTVIRGTPVVVQLMIMYFVIMVSEKNGVIVAIIAFGINSGAYVAEIFRSGIMSINEGQFEAGRSLGFSYLKTMIYIIIPQAVKVILPTLFNELIVLVKETSIAGYVGVVDLTKAGDRIRGRTFEAFLPLLAVAIVYLVIVIILTQILRLIERRLRKNER